VFKALDVGGGWGGLAPPTFRMCLRKFSAYLSGKFFRQYSASDAFGILSADSVRSDRQSVALVGSRSQPLASSMSGR
jgi:hypothetical protein